MVPARPRAAWRQRAASCQEHGDCEGGAQRSVGGTVALAGSRSQQRGVRCSGPGQRAVWSKGPGQRAAAAWCQRAAWCQGERAAWCQRPGQRAAWCQGPGQWAAWRQGQRSVSRQRCVSSSNGGRRGARGGGPGRRAAWCQTGRGCGQRSVRRSVVSAGCVGSVGGMVPGGREAARADKQISR